MTTVGYGDLSPKSDGGKFVTMLATLAGLINIALPLAIVGDNFIEVWQNRLLEYVLGKIQDELHVRQVGDCVKAFNAFDPKGDGFVDWIKFKRGTSRHLQLQGALRLSELFTVWTQMDRSGTGRITLLEFCELFFPEAEMEISELLRQYSKTRPVAPPRLAADTGGSQSAPAPAGVLTVTLPSEKVGLPTGKVEARLAAIEATLSDLADLLRGQRRDKEGEPSHTYNGKPPAPHAPSGGGSDDAPPLSKMISAHL